ncbi:chorion peroxidase-like [Elysia marginata]|uniref:Chorion peroxidase-like n=1 Tax=Elysia marginata TaxID=1093978 RepID=A0AAV4GC08_9GAST|nr:chorion peroxidase-like [Elysia marginata]
MHDSTESLRLDTYSKVFRYWLFQELFLGGRNRTRLRDLFFKPYLLFENFDEICINLVTGFSDKDRSQEYDSFITEEVTNHLFETQEGPMQGFDLVALNLQRGRDHAIPPYNDYRELCGLHRITRFDDPVLGAAGPVLAQVYDHPDDIELFSGGVSERSAFGGVVGETFNCLITRQMRSLKFGDRYFFTHERGNQGFNNAQLFEIHKYTLSHFMCETTGMAQIQVDAFRKPGYDVDDDNGGSDDDGGGGDDSDDDGDDDDDDNDDDDEDDDDDDDDNDDDDDDDD